VEAPSVGLNSINIMESRTVRWVRCGTYGEKKSVFGVSGGKPVEKSRLGSCRWEDNIKIDLQEME
jgi:hypothetical protein